MIDLYKKRAKILNAMGVINHDLRYKPDAAMKGAVTKAWNKHISIANNLQDFAIKIVSNKTAKKITDAKLQVKTSSGRTKLFIPTFGKKVTISRGHVVRESPGFKEKSYPIDKDVFNTASKLFADKKKGEYIMVSVGTNAHFSTVFHGMAEFERYLSEWKPKDKTTKKHKQDLISSLTLTVAKGRAIDTSSRGNKQWQKRKGKR